MKGLKLYYLEVGKVIPDSGTEVHTAQKTIFEMVCILAHQ